ncbi:uncharacterized protein METZ01_LOCUS445491 [marine metagenome]|uniref:Uncharacterized protein n=1 Tax=marine metagenome TaxID=408172 RepID=A0A382ZAV7_9ZZZZ
MYRWKKFIRLEHIILWPNMQPLFEFMRRWELAGGILNQID